MIFIDPKLWQVASGTPIGNVAVGGIIQLRENLVPVDYIVVHQGLPGSMYDASCDGTWLLRQDIAENRVWDSSKVNNYANSTINGYLNSAFLNLFDSSVQSAIKQVKIPYVNGTADSPVAFGSNGLSCKIFLLSGFEVGFSKSVSPYIPGDGAKLSYFGYGIDTSANDKRIAKLNGLAANWWLRSPFNGSSNDALTVFTSGGWNYYWCTASHGIRPALVLPSDFRI